MLEKGHGIFRIDHVTREQWEHPLLSDPGREIEAIDPGMYNFTY